MVPEYLVDLELKLVNVGEGLSLLSHNTPKTPLLKQFFSVDSMRYFKVISISIMKFCYAEIMLGQ